MKCKGKDRVRWKAKNKGIASKRNVKIAHSLLISGLVSLVSPPTATTTTTTSSWNNRKVFFLGKCIWGLNDLFVECKNFWFYLLYPLSCSSSIWLVCVVAQDDDVYTHVFMQKILCHSPINFHFYTMNLWLNAIYSCKKSRYE